MIGPAPIADDPATGARIMRLSEDLEGVCAGLGVAYLPIFGHCVLQKHMRKGVMLRIISKLIER